MRKVPYKLLFFFWFLTACSGSDSNSPAPQPKPFCSDTYSYSSYLTVTGRALYQYRTNGNGAVHGTPNPIRQSEISVVDSTGNIVQCGATDNNGNFSLVVPNPAAGLKVRIHSRISNSLTKAYVLDNPNDMNQHFIQSPAFDATSNHSVGNLIAPATGTLEGGAFNILDKVLIANEFLLNETNLCNADFTNCKPFTGSPLVKIFWTKGLNPGSYFNAGPISFYIPGDRELYILGGFSGDVDNSDTDHFDDSIIIHEYGHFIEDVFSKTDSPGGSHDANSIIDPRLAWGEGWANFFQGVVLQRPYYRDTIGTTNGTPNTLLYRNLETADLDVPNLAGEGNFREFSIARLLWDAVDDGSLNSPPIDDDSVITPFAELWTVFTNTVNGFAYGGYQFRDVGLFHKIQTALTNGQDWSTLRSAERQRADQRDTARSVTRRVASCSPVATTITPTGTAGSGFSSSNFLTANDFYKIYHGGGAFNLQMEHELVSQPGIAPDLDVYIYKEGYRFGRSADMAAFGKTESPIGAPYKGSESISTVLPAGYYMINIHTNMSLRVGGSAEYIMRLNGENLCPSN